MNNQQVNASLSAGDIDKKGLFPHLDQLEKQEYIFNIDFGLTSLPTEPGIILIRGARQYGKSTWLESQLKETIQAFGPNTAFYLNGDNLLTHSNLEKAILDLTPIFSNNAPVKRIFIDEITAIPDWEIALKKLSDNNIIQDILIITTGSSATDLRRGTEKLPGRKGKLSRTNFLFTPIPYREFKRVTGKKLKKNTLAAYLISGGSPNACSEIAKNGYIPEYIITLTRDWVEGEIARSGRSRISLNNILNVLYKFGGCPIGQAKLAREAALANNSVAVGYIEILHDLGVITPAYAWDKDKQLPILRKPCKFHFTNLLAAIAYHPNRIRSIEDFNNLTSQNQGMWIEWLVSQDLLRKNTDDQSTILEPQYFWQSKSHEIDFVTSQEYIEVKRGKVSPLEFSWFHGQFPNKRLTVINPNEFDTECISGISLEKFLET